jgi:hypothetical protein
MKLLILATVFLSTTAFASDKYKCVVPVSSEIGIGLETDIEVLSDTSANVYSYETSKEYPKVSLVEIDNPGLVTASEKVLHLRNHVTSIQNPTVNGEMQIAFDVPTVSFQFETDKDGTNFPCEKVEYF